MVPPNFIIVRLKPKTPTHMFFSGVASLLERLRDE